MSTYRIVKIRLVETGKDGVTLARPFYGIRLSMPMPNGDTLYPDFNIDAEDADLSGVRPGDTVTGEFSLSKSQSEPDKNGKIWDNYRAYPTGDVKIAKGIRPKITVE